VKVQLDGSGTRPLADNEIELEILHRRIEKLLHHVIQSMDLVDKEDVPGLEICQDGCEIAGTLQDWARGGLEAHRELLGDNVGEAGLAQAGEPVKEDVVEGLVSRPGRLDENLEVLLQPLLPYVFIEAQGPQVDFKPGFLRPPQAVYQTFFHGIGPLPVVGHARERRQCWSRLSKVMFRWRSLHACSTARWATALL
jgi:hypothetical protein